MWFEALTGFEETTPGAVRENLQLSGETLTSRVNGKRWHCGTLQILPLDALRRSAGGGGGRLRVRQEVADVQALHADPANAGALFQVASQFNLLEMVSPEITPEQGIDIYDKDLTQGPACAMAAGAGTLYRHYFVPTGGGIGQSASHQIDCLAGIGKALSNGGDPLWEMRNGYALASRNGLEQIARQLENRTVRDRLRGLLDVGIQWQTQVTLPGCSHWVSQIYCSALPVAYSAHPAALWWDFALLILEAAYEATLCAGVCNAREHGNNRVYLTMLGGGAFGNGTDWIVQAMERAFTLHAASDLDVRIVSFRTPNPALEPLVR